MSEHSTLGSSNLVCVGAIAGAFGVRGDVRLKSFCADAEAIADYAPLTTEDGAQSFTLKITGAIKNGLSARLDGVTSPEAANRLKGVKLYAPRDRLPEPEEDEYYYADLIGCEAFDTGGTLIGRIHAVNDHGAGDFLEITGPGIKNSLLLPFTRETVPTVDIAARKLVIDMPEEILAKDDG